MEAVPERRRKVALRMRLTSDMRSRSGIYAINYAAGLYAGTKFCGDTSIASVHRPSFSSTDESSSPATNSSAITIESSPACLWIKSSLESASSSKLTSETSCVTRGYVVRTRVF